jgi:hypothetical protein
VARTLTHAETKAVLWASGIDLGFLHGCVECNEAFETRGGLTYHKRRPHRADWLAPEVRRTLVGHSATVAEARAYLRGE